MRSLICLSFSAIAITGAANADFVDVYGNSIGFGQTFSVTQNSVTENVIAGQIGITLSNSTGVNLDGSWISFCTEISQNIYIGGATQTYLVAPVSDLPIPGAGMGAARASAIARMYAAAAGAQYAADNDYAGAFALAIWEISTDYDGSAGSLDLGNGNFVVNSSLNAQTALDMAFLLAAAGNTDGPQASILGLGNESYQDLIIEVPAPGALALLGVAGCIAARRRRS